MSCKNATSNRATWFLWAIAILVVGSVGGVTHGQFPELPSRPEKVPPKKPLAPAKDKATQPELWEPGDEIDPPRTPADGKTPARGTTRDGAGASDAAKGVDDGPAWSVLVASFAKEDHAEVARAMRERLVARYPQLRESFIEKVAGGSVILVGRFKGPDDPAAQAKLKEVKGIVSDGQRPFATAMLTRTATSADRPGPYDISKLREQFPHVDPLYSLQVAAWSNFGETQSKGLTPKDIRALAENYCKELRAKGFEAWVHHDGSKDTSVVTVGHFDQHAYDSKSTLFAPEVEDLMKKFPRHLLNGDEVLVPVDPNRPKGPMRPQACRLVLVPK